MMKALEISDGNAATDADSETVPLHQGQSPRRSFSLFRRSTQSSSQHLPDHTLPPPAACSCKLSRVKKFQVAVWIVAFLALIYVEREFVFIQTSNIPNATSTDKVKRTPQPTSLPTSIPVATQASTPVPTSQQSSTPSVNENYDDDDISGNSTDFNDDNSTHTMESPVKSPSDLPSRPPIIFNVTSPLKPPPLSTLPLALLPNKTQTFVQSYCNIGNEEWFPIQQQQQQQLNSNTSNVTIIQGNLNKNAWQMRAPYVFLAGALDSGLSSLGRALYLHPQVLPKSSTGVVADFFLPTLFAKYQTSIGVTKRTNVYTARLNFYATIDSRAFKESNSSIALDMSPRYMYYGYQTARAMQCVVPWAKYVFILRNPVQRIYQQWIDERINLGLKSTFEDWIAPDWKAMYQYGFATSTFQTTEDASRNNFTPINGGINGDHHSADEDVTTLFQIHNKETETSAWNQYKSSRDLIRAIGKSLYVIQLEQWFETLQALGKDPRQEIHLVRSELWDSQPQTEFQQLVDFLGLASFTPPTLSTTASATTPTAAAPADTSSVVPPPAMNSETRKRLEQFFAPYNKRLKALLQEYGFNEDGDWNEPLWE